MLNLPLPKSELEKVSFSGLLDKLFQYLLSCDPNKISPEELKSLIAQSKAFDWRTSYIAKLPHDLQTQPLYANSLVNLAIALSIDVPIDSLNDECLRDSEGNLINSSRYP